MLTKSEKGLGHCNGYYPMLATIVTAKSNEKKNAMAVAWHAIVSMHPPMYGVSISPKRHTHGMIVDSGSFGVNFIPGEEAELIAAVGGCSGKDIDKFEELGIEIVETLVLDVPILKVAYMALECRWVSTLKCGDHDWFVGKIEAAHHSSSAFNQEGTLIFESATPTTYMGNDRYFIINKGELRHLDRKMCISKRKESILGNQ